MNLKRAAMEHAMDELPPIVAVGGVVYRRTPEGRIELLLIKKRGGFWTLPKGKIEPGEADHTAVVREISEETGIEGYVESDVLRVLYTIHKAGQPRLKTVTYYLVRAYQGTLRPDPKEQIQRVRWFAIDSALRRIRRERIREVVQAARQLLEGTEQASGRG